VIVLSHRGAWTSAAEKNRPVAFRRSFDEGFGTETDVRDRGGELVIAHDMAHPDDIRLEDMLDILDGRDLPLAINIKADGLGPALAEQMRARGLTNWFTFDMAAPDLVYQVRIGLPVFTRVSDYEPSPVCYEQAVGVWLDGFEGDWFDERDVASFLREGKKVCVVSPELHRRDPESVWAMLRSPALSGHPGLMLCTDRPQAAAEYFGGVA
jgi:hypothetical protein